MRFEISKNVTPYCMVRLQKGKKLVRTNNLGKAIGQYLPRSKTKYITIDTGKLEEIELPERINYRGLLEVEE